MLLVDRGPVDFRSRSGRLETDRSGTKLGNAPATRVRKDALQFPRADLCIFFSAPEHPDEPLSNKCFQRGASQLNLLIPWLLV